MSGGHFNYADQSAGWWVDEKLIESIAELSDIDRDAEQEARLECAKILQAVYKIATDMAHDYDWAASGDTAFERVPGKFAAHLRVLGEVVEESDQ